MFGSKMIKQGIRYIDFVLVSFSKIYIHNPGIIEYDADKKYRIKNLKGKIVVYKVQHELLEMINVPDRLRPIYSEKLPLCLL